MASAYQDPPNSTYTDSVMRAYYFVLWFFSKIVGLLLFFACIYVFFQFPGAFIWLYLTDGYIDGLLDKAVYGIGLGVSMLFWYGIYNTEVGFRLLEPVLHNVMNLLEHGYWKGDDYH